MLKSLELRAPIASGTALTEGSAIRLSERLISVFDEECQRDVMELYSPQECLPRVRANASLDYFVHCLACARTLAA